MAGVLTDLLGTLGLVVLATLSYRLKATDGMGSVTAFLMGFIIGLTAGWVWVSYLVVFLAAGTLATKFKYDFKSKLQAAQEKGGARGMLNVIANGGIPTLLAVIFTISPHLVLALMFVSSVSSALADTLGTEIGLLSKTVPKMLISGAETQPGRSGGVTKLGILAELVGSSLFSVFGFVLGIIPLYVVALAAVGGFLGSNMDSLLGATVQGYFVCDVCGLSTERKVHCSKQTRKVSGFSWLGNNEVNLIGAASGPLISAGLYLLLL
jgi:uncharacterized protein (TIGR00297 family)